jgi:hypothetical protein
MSVSSGRGQLLVRADICFIFVFDSDTIIDKILCTIRNWRHIELATTVKYTFRYVATVAIAQAKIKPPIN